MNWKTIGKGLSTIEFGGPTVEITGVEYDSRRIKHGDVFVAMLGGATDGNQYIERALAQGAVAVITDSRKVYEQLRGEHSDIASALVERGRRALAEVSLELMEHPERKLALSAVTGTNGKTTTAFLLESLLRGVGRTCVLMGTIETHVGDEVRKSPHTTSESRDVLEVFADGVKVGATEAVMEMSSHALEQERVWGLPVDVAIFTNLTQDHLDYHGTMENYLAAKTRLFEGVGAPPPRVAVINIDDEAGERLALSVKGSQMIRYGLRGRGEFRADELRVQAGETRFRMTTPIGAIDVKSPLTGRVNVYNLLAASAGAWARGLTLDEVVASVAKVKQVPGRFEIVSSLNEVTVVVDYAHTDDALRNLIALARELVKERGGKVITLFGCGGDRDRTKRPKMGRVAGEGSDLVVLTSDNPRSEHPIKIIEEALVGVKATGTKYIVEQDRAGAIEIAIRSARAEDIVLLAGKGHEKVQILKDGTIPFDDVIAARAVLKKIA
jgi:UDP-N-acetylmuramoyl-L-alanyl-D-glutamate--2,6-diaminopimelate ligase